MISNDLLLALYRVVPHLDTLIPTDERGVFMRTLRRLLVYLGETEDEQVLSQGLDDIVDLFYRYDQAKVVLDEARAEVILDAAPWWTEMRGHNGTNTPDEGSITASAKEVAVASAALAQGTVQRYTDVVYPPEVSLEIPRFSIEVGLTVEPSLVSQNEPLALYLQQEIPVMIDLHVCSADLAILGDSHRELLIRPHADSFPQVFHLQPLEVGPTVVRLSFRQSDQMLGDITLHLEVVERQRESIQARALSQEISASIWPSPNVPPDVELEIFQVEKANGTWLEYTLRCNKPDLGYPYYRIPSDPDGNLKLSPARYAEHLFARMTKLLSGKAIHGTILTDEEVQTELELVGHNLYYALFPSSLKAVYRQIRGRFRTLRLISNEPHIPWELIKPESGSERGELFEDDFLCQQYAMSRWLAGENGWTHEIRVESVACVAPTSAGLPATDLEWEYFQNLVATHPTLHNKGLRPAPLSKVATLLDDGNYHILHFACHGGYEGQAPDESVILLDADSGTSSATLEPEDITGQRMRHIHDAHPLIFLNACHSGRMGYNLTGLAGWADRFVRKSGCGAFIAPLWPVTDEPAAVFSTSFYDALLDGQSFAVAMQEARGKVRSQFPGDSTWAAYVLYANPTGVIYMTNSTNIPGSS
jgi:hypothetical protein